MRHEHFSPQRVRNPSIVIWPFHNCDLFYVQRLAHQNIRQHAWPTNQLLKLKPTHTKTSSTPVLHNPHDQMQTIKTVSQYPVCQGCKLEFKLYWTEIHHHKVRRKNKYSEDGSELFKDPHQNLLTASGVTGSYACVNPRVLSQICWQRQRKAPKDHWQQMARDSNDLVVDMRSPSQK